MPRIMLVDDDPNIHLIYQKQFEAEFAPGTYQLIHCDNGEEALAQLEQQPVELLLTDLHMPVMDGLQLLKKVRLSYPETLTLVVSGFDEMDNLRAAMNAGAFDFLTKPVDFADLALTVRRALEAHKERHQMVFEKSRAEAGLKRFAKTLDLSRNGLFLATPEGYQVIYANRGGLDMLGLSAEVALKTDLFGLLKGLSRSWLTEQLKALSSGRLPKAEFEWTPPGGPPIEGTLQFVQLGPKEGRFLINLLDISKRQAFKSQHQMLAKAVEQVGDLVLITDKEGHILYVNPAFEQTTGYSAAEVIGKTPSLLKSGRHSAEFYDEIWKTLLSGASWQGEFIDKKKNGKFFWAEATLSPVTDEKGEIQQFFSVSRDKTQERKVQAQMLQSQKMESIGTLAGGIAHEINNPIGFVYSNVNSLQGYLADFLGLLKLYHDLEVFIEPSDEKTKALLREIEARKKKIDLDFLISDLPGLVKDTLDGAERVKGIVSNLREFSHTGSGQMTRSDLNEGIKKTLRLLSNELKYKTDLHLDLGKLEPVLCYPQEINQVFLNLILNAIQAIEDHGKLTIRSSQDGDWAVIKIKDTGCGIAEENLPRLFEPFYTTKGVGQGTGLGLSVSYNIVKKHKGKILVESKLGIGTQFTVRLPLNPEKVEN
ncbi:MAG: PAS domain S-box protein [bacterium]|nr:PAS domain S-box protein [bacterium]